MGVMVAGLGASRDAPQSDVRGAGRLRKMNLPLRVSSILFFLWCAVSPGIGFQKPEQAPRFQVAVNLVSVDVIVTDKKGEFPPDLRAEDFQLFEDGVLQQIQNFEAIHAGGSRSRPAPPSEAPSVVPGLVPGASDRSKGRFMLLVLDNLNSRWANLSQVKSSLEALISESLLPDDMVAIATVSHSARLVQNFTTNRQALLAAVHRGLERSVQGDLAKDEVDRVINEAALEDNSTEWRGQSVNLDEAEMARREAAKALSLQNDYGARNALFTLKSLCDALSRLRGRKTVVFVSEGLGASSSVESILSSTVSAANRANVAIYTMDPRGLELIDLSQTATLGQKPRERTLASTGIVTGGSTDFDLMRLEGRMTSRDDSLTMLSQQTGGVSLRRSNAFSSFLDQVHRENHFYYQLTYAPANPVMDGKYRRIEVKLLREGYTIRARHGYYATDDPAGLVGTAEDQMYQALLSPRPIEQLGVAVAPAQFLDPSGNSLVVLTLRVAPETVTLSGAGGRNLASLQLLAAAFDEAGKVAREYRHDYRLVIEGERLQRFRREGASVSLSFTLAPGKYQVKTVLRENETGRMGVKREEIQIPSCSRQAPCLSSLVLAESFLPRAGTPSKEAGPKRDYDPLLYGSSVIQPSATRQFPRDRPLYVFFHAYNVADPADPRRSPYRYRMTLFRDEDLITQSEALPLQPGFRHSQGGFLQTSKLSLAPLMPGTYTLELELLGAENRGRASRSATFKVQ